MREERRIGGRGLVLQQGDITQISVDAIVNAANTALAGGGGVDGAIHRAGGPQLMAELRANHRGCATGDAVVTGAGDLGARWVIHAVGPVWKGGREREPELLARAYRAAMARAAEVGARTVALPAISCGVYGYPVEAAARIAIDTVVDHLRGETPVERATFVLYSSDTFETFREALRALDERSS